MVYAFWDRGPIFDTNKLIAYSALMCAHRPTWFKFNIPEPACCSPSMLFVCCAGRYFTVVPGAIGAYRLWGCWAFLFFLQGRAVMGLLVCCFPWPSSLGGVGKLSREAGLRGLLAGSWAVCGGFALHRAAALYLGPSLCALVSGYCLASPGSDKGLQAAFFGRSCGRGAVARGPAQELGLDLPVGDGKPACAPTVCPWPSFVFVGAKPSSPMGPGRELPAATPPRPQNRTGNRPRSGGTINVPALSTKP